ncbi:MULTISPECIES: TetR/AcrR family transcriptional regulator [unclassified Corynebacterium]|uniref:TetR/AcrR family transcriptional regulator n=1 Tax=unclassified Corynebacterium TaxID=2624378 RepID=UPI0029CAA1BA|nr:MULTISPECIES: TetR/AcrR family transcriptional regulator [unclassified Corynebacterium]WPF66012.1 TetR/AcrR family transcriptional regulator [Corynebacterium sp. 22KM0430]WPF68505.1 TetR/AcrR family transcriptional regulator [Corynebacterium sp. 21KM1197]
MATLERKDYHHGDLRRALIASAREILATGEGFSLRAVAKRAGVSPTATYRHFEDRKALESAVAGQGYRELHGYLEEAVGEVNGLGDAWKVAVAYAQWALDNPAIFSLMFTTDCDPQDTERTRAVAELKGFLTQEMVALAPERATEDFIIATWAFVHGITLLHAEGKLSTEAPREMEERIRRSWGALMG